MNGIFNNVAAVTFKLAANIILSYILASIQLVTGSAELNVTDMRWVLKSSSVPSLTGLQ
jgi:hypothetical protein